MFKNLNYNENKLEDLNLQLESFLGRKLIQIKFREIGNVFLLVFSNNISDDFHSVIHFFNCFLFNEDGIEKCPITEIFIKNLGVFAFEYCTRHGIDTENLLEFRMVAEAESGSESQEIKSVLIGCERIAITESIVDTSNFWEL